MIANAARHGSYGINGRYSAYGNALMAAYFPDVVFARTALPAHPRHATRSARWWRITSRISSSTAPPATTAPRDTSIPKRAHRRIRCGCGLSRARGRHRRASEGRPAQDGDNIWCRLRGASRRRAPYRAARSPTRRPPGRRRSRRAPGRLATGSRSARPTRPSTRLRPPARTP